MKLCAFCNQPFTAYHLNRQKYCSKACQRKGWRGTRRQWTHCPVVTCEWCKQSFKPPSRKSRFCSLACRDNGQRGTNGARWKGGRITRPDGYIDAFAPNHPSLQHHKSGKRYLREHRLVMEQHLDRILEPHETVHHINGDRSDNRIENLQLHSGKHGKGVRHICADCGSSNIRSETI